MTNESRRHLDGVQERLQAIRSSIRLDDSLEVGWGRQEEIVGLLSDVTYNFADAVDSRRDEHVEVVQRIATVESEIRAVARDVASLCKVVRDGNGQPPMVHRLTTVENTLLTHTHQIKEIGKHANSIIASRMLTRTQLVVGLSGMLVTAIISFAALVATLLKG